MSSHMHPHCVLGIAIYRTMMLMSFTQHICLMNYIVFFHPFAVADVNTAYQQAARNVLIENEALLQRFKLTITTSAPTTPSAPTPRPADRSELVKMFTKRFTYATTCIIIYNKCTPAACKTVVQWNTFEDHPPKIE